MPIELNRKTIEMVRKLYLFPILFAAICLSLASCMDDDDDDVVIDEEWKALNETRFEQVGQKGGYHELSSQSGNGKIYWKRSDEIDNSNNEEAGLRITVDRKPEFTDTVVVRYEGWYFDIPGEKVIFDSTENPSLKTQINYSLGMIPSPYPNKVAQKFAVSGVIDGWTTILQDMTVGDEREICIPHALGYRSNAQTYTPSSTTYTLIPGYTTLWFRMKLLKIIPMSGYSS